MIAGMKTVLSVELPPVHFTKQNGFNIPSTQKAMYCLNFAVIANAV